MSDSLVKLTEHESASRETVRWRLAENDLKPWCNDMWCTPPAEARRVRCRLDFHYTPKRGGWLNMVEIEIGVLRSQCLDRRIGTRKCLVSEIAAWQRQRNHSGACIEWMFTIDKARSKMARAHPETPCNMASQLKES